MGTWIFLIRGSDSALRGVSTTTNWWALWLYLKLIKHSPEIVIVPSTKRSVPATVFLTQYGRTNVREVLLLAQVVLPLFN